MRGFVVILALMLSTSPSLAVNPDEILSDPVLEERARDLSKGLRCVRCRNQSIDDSNAAIARDMRVVLRERLVAGDSDAEAVAYLQDRYGTYILLKPPVNTLTYALWIGPAVFLALAGFGFAGLWRRRGVEAEQAELQPEDRAMVQMLLGQKREGQ